MTEPTKHNVPAGDICYYYIDGNVQGDPRIAISTRNDPHGILDLSIIKPFARSFDSVDGVRYWDDPWLKTHPEHRQQNGVWDYKPGSGPQIETIARQIIKELGGKQVILRALTDFAKQDKK